VTTAKKRTAGLVEFASIEDAEKRRAALEIHERIIKELASLEQTKQSIVKICARSIGVPEEKYVNRIIWHGIVRYANADLSDSTGVAEAFLAFHAFSTLCLAHTRDPLFESVDISDAFFQDLEADSDITYTFDGFFNACCRRLVDLYSQFRGVLKWLTDPNGYSASQRNQARKFLAEHAGEGAIEFELDANDNFDDTGNDGAPYYYWKRAVSYRTILSPVTRYILDRIERYQADEEQLRLVHSKAIPLMICKRSGCDRFLVLQRKTRDFCNASCRTLHRQATNPEKHAAYQREYRRVFKKPR
jgi:hypothetical protein